MRSPCLFLLTLFSFPSSSAQFLLPVKEQSDHIVHKQLYNGTYIGLASYATDYVDTWSTYKYPEAVGQLQLGYMQMYRTTKDKAYLVKFINIALRAMAWRRENYLFTDGTIYGSTLYKNGVLLWAFSDFIHLLSLEEPELQSSPLVETLLIIPTSTIPENIIPVAARSTYGSVAQWLLARSRETLDHILASHWSEEEVLRGGDVIKGLNQEAVFGSAMLNLGSIAASTGNNDMLGYLEKGALMLRKFRNQGEDDRCNCILGLPVLLNNTNNSYYWFHDGWSHSLRDGICFYIDCDGATGIANNERDLSSRHEFMEDISHGVYDMELPRLSNIYNIYTGGSEPFTDIDMIKFRNAFTTQIAVPYQGSWGFCSGVYGCDALVGVDEGVGFNYYRKDAMSWMFLHEWDDAIGAEPGPGVYEILTTFYSTDIFPNPIDITSGFTYWGVAQVVAAQWERECFSLDLYNRELVYDQDFAAKKVLRIFPEGETGASFADPVIYEPRFTVKENIHAQFRAGSAVIFEPGFEAEHGSVVEALIDPLGCDLAYKAAIPTYGRTEVTLLADQHAEAEPEDLNNAAPELSQASLGDALRLSPNPSTEQTHALITLGTPREVAITLIDGTGRTVWSMAPGQLPEGEHRLPLAAGLARGIYHCIAHLDGEAHHERLVVE
ncbi:MAG: hypothetical protein R2817_08835 [Flavobacteriales bacterium]